MYRYTVLGSGRQGAAIAYDLIRNGEAEHLVLADMDARSAQEASQKINLLTDRNVCVAAQCNGEDIPSLRTTIRGSHAVVSALPYFLNPNAAKAAIDEKAHFTDLGGNTDIVLKELELDFQAKKAGVSVLPDCGLAPGLSNLLAARALDLLDTVDTIRARCGGLPQLPRPPLNYKMVFSLHGLINEYSGDAIFLRNGSITKVKALTEIEELDIRGVGKFEAAVTTGGTSTAPYTFKGKVKNFDYKTLRYPGHFSKLSAYRDLGLFEESRRPAFFEMLAPLIDFPNDRDMVILLVDGIGKKKGKKKKYRALLVDKGDAKKHFSAMERTTGFPTAVISHLQASGKIAAGAQPIEQAVPLQDFMEGLALRGIKIVETIK